MTDEEIIALFDRSKTVAVVGASENPEKPSNKIPKILLDAGFTMIPVNPTAQEIHGQKVYASLEDIRCTSTSSTSFARPPKRPAWPRER